jgi:2-oxoglutarate ferredoxin oxidoreductase subunit gamma
MERGSSTRHEVIMSGIGGKGILVAGQLLAEVGIQKYKYVTWTPTYFAAMRGGSCECTVILSSEKITSPLLTKAEVVIVFEPSQLKDFEVRVKQNGILITESTGLLEVKRQDIRIVKVPATETAVKLGGIMAANLVLLGTYVEITKVIPPELVEIEIEQKFSGDEKKLSLNKQAFRQGMLLAVREQNLALSK